jgi:hypothetical protein
LATKLPIEHLTLLQQICQLATAVYQSEGVMRFSSTSLAAFGNCTALDMLLEGKFDAVLAALAADYE